MEIKQNIPFSRLTFWGIGGPADHVAYPESTDELAQVWSQCHQEGTPVFILGKGANACFADEGFRGTVVVLKQKDLHWEDNATLNVTAGYDWQKFVESVAQQGWADVINLSGIPGTVGGCVRGNAGAFGAETQDTLIDVTYVDAQGKLHTRPKSELDFHYRESLFKSHPDWCVASARFRFTHPADPTDALQQTKDLNKKRWAKYPKGRSGGSFFKNPDADFSGRLLESVGAKGQCVGGICIAEDHANFFLNKSNGTQADLLELARTWRDRVQGETGILLHPEVHLVDPCGKTITL